MARGLPGLGRGSLAFQVMNWTPGSMFFFRPVPYSAFGWALKYVEHSFDVPNFESKLETVTDSPGPAGARVVTVGRRIGWPCVPPVLVQRSSRCAFTVAGWSPSRLLEKLTRAASESSLPVQPRIMIRGDSARREEGAAGLGLGTGQA